MTTGAHFLRLTSYKHFSIGLRAKTAPYKPKIRRRTTGTLLPRSFVVLYADDILLTAPSVSELQELFDACVIELSWLDMNINEKVLLYPYLSTMGCEVQEH